MRRTQFYSCTSCALAALISLWIFLSPGCALAQCGWFNGPPLISYVGCLTINDQAYGRSYRIAVPLNCYNNCGAALPGNPFIRAVNLRTGYSVTVWSGGCGFYLGNNTGPCSGTAESGFSLLDRDFAPGDVVRIDAMVKPSGSDAPFVCTENVANFHYPPALIPEIFEQPQDQMVSPGSAGVFRVGAGPGEMTYQWSKNGTPIPGADGPTLIVEAADSSAAGSYGVRVRNDCGATMSTSATLMISTDGPVISRPPESRTVCEGESVTFSFDAHSAQSATYQWLHNGVPLEGANSASLMISNVIVADGGSYRVTMASGGVSFTTAAATLNILEFPRITAQPQSAIVCQRAPVVLSVSVAGSPPFRFQWRLNGTPLPGAINGTLAGMSSDFTAGNYDVVVENACGRVTSAIAMVSALRNVLQPDGRVLIEWTDPFDLLQWSSNLVDWVDLPDAVSPYVVSGLDAPRRFFRLHCGDRTPTVLRHPDSAILDHGDHFALSGAGEGPAPLSYQWLFNGTNVAGATRSTLVLTNVSSAQVGVYELRVSNGYGSVTSQVAYVVIRDNVDGLAPSTQFATPPVSLLLLHSENLTGLSLNATVALPTVNALLLLNENLTGLPFNTTIAQPPVNILFLGTNSSLDLPPNTTVAKPPVDILQNH